MVRLRPSVLVSILVLWIGIFSVQSGWGADNKPPIDLMAEATQVGGYLLLLIVLAVLAIHLGKRFQPGLGGQGPICIEDGRNLAPGVGVRLVRVGSRAWLLGVTKDQVSLLAELDAGDFTTSSTPKHNAHQSPGEHV